MANIRDNDTRDDDDIRDNDDRGTLADTLHDDSAAPTPLVRDPDLWFSDGSVVLRAHNSLFRVHMSQLARKSLFFRDLFALPQPRSPSSSADPSHLPHSHQPAFEGCPLIILHDSPSDLAHLLQALYDGPNFGSNDRADFSIVSGILRLATKYFVDSLRAKALTHLCQAWPSTLKAWDAREDSARNYEITHAAHRGHFFPSPIAVINLAREIDAPELLPAAFYDLSRYHFTQIFEPAPDEPLFCAPESLSAPDARRLALGKEASHLAVTALITSMGAGAHRDGGSGAALAHGHAPAAAHAPTRRKAAGGAVCVSAAACRKDFKELVDLATQHYLFDRERGCADPLYVAEELGQLKSAEFSECAACARALEAWAARERDRIWKAVPAWFRLDA